MTPMGFGFPFLLVVAAGLFAAWVLLGLAGLRRR